MMEILPKLNQVELQKILIEINNRVESNHDENLETVINEIISKLLVYS